MFGRMGFKNLHFRLDLLPSFSDCLNCFFEVLSLRLPCLERKNALWERREIIESRIFKH